MRAFLIWLTLTGIAWAEGEKAGDFDYYVLALSWSPNWCAVEGDARDADQCDPKHDYGWILHGLWPQNESGWPSYCRTPHRDASRSQTRGMRDVMASPGLAWHQWKKHGRCSGLTAADYFDLSRQAYNAVNRPAVFRKIPNTVKVPAHVVEEAFLEDNPMLTADMITVTCKSKHIQEVRICLTKDLESRKCGRDVVRDCTLNDALLTPVR